MGTARARVEGAAGEGRPRRRRGRPSLAEGPAVTREAIVAVALGAVQANGLAGLALREVARRLEVSLPTVQRHFATKDDLWRACVDSVLADYLPDGPLPWEPGPGGVTGDGQLLSNHLRYQIERAARAPRFTAAMLNDNEPGAEERFAYLVERRQPVVARARAMVGAAVASGVVRPVDVNVFLALVGLGLSSLVSSGGGLRQLFDIDLDDPEQKERYVASLADLLLYGLLPRSEPPGKKG